MDKNIYMLYLMKIIKENIHITEKIEINIKKVKTIKELKYYIINKYKSHNFCPCQLIISEFFGNGLIFSDLNDLPEKRIDENFPNHKIYINIISNKNCNCGFETLNFLSKIEIYENYMSKIRKLILKYEIIINEKERKIKELEELNNELLNNIDKQININNDDLNCISNEINNNIVTFKQYEDSVKNEDFYDLIINIKSIKQLNTGWDIIMNEKGKLRYEEYKNQPSLIIGIIGNSNKGKSFLLSKLSKINIPNGTNIKTEGLSIKYPELKKYKNRKIVLLDSEGFESPFLLEKSRGDELDDIMLKEQAKEKLITEFFLQDFILNTSDILIAVVGLLTFQEQKFINKIKSEISKLKLKKTLFVIHNLMTLTTIKQVEKYINKTLMNSATFELEKTTLISIEKTSGEKQVEYFFEKDRKIQIIHLIFANEGSEAGNFYNSFALNFIEKYFLNITNIKPFDVIEKVKERFVNLSNILLENNKKYPIMTKDDFLDNIDILKEKKLRLKNKREIILKRLFIDELGFSNLRNNFNPCFNYYRKNNSLILRMEAPGNINLSCNHRIVEKYNMIEIRGIKNKDNEPINLIDNIYNSREFGEFSIDIPLMIDLENKQPIISKRDGIFIIEFAIKERLSSIFEYKGDDEQI